MKTLLTSVVMLAVLSLFAMQAFAGVAAEGGDRGEQTFALYLPNTGEGDAAVLPECRVAVAVQDQDGTANCSRGDRDLTHNPIEPSRIITED